MWGFAWLALAFGELIDEFNVLSIFQHSEGYRCKTRMFSAPTNPSETMPVLERLQESAHWCAMHPSCFGVQLYDGGEQDLSYCMKWCGRPQWCLSPILDSHGDLTDVPSET